MNYGSICSGIEAPGTAWRSLGWEPAWFSEIEEFPNAVLKHRWPGVPNHGDMTGLPLLINEQEVAAPPLVVGGSPCQAFSTAGAGGSLSDERGALTLAYVEIINQVDEVRKQNGQPECIAVWENVPGVLSTKDNAFGCLLAGLAGEEEPLEPAGKRWANAGYVHGPRRDIAWRVLNAEHFGVPQRRRRVFLVATAREDVDPAEILFEREGDSRYPSEIQSEGQDTSSGTSEGDGCFWDGGQVTQTLDAVLHKGQMMPEKNRFPVVIQRGYPRKITPLESERLQGFPDGHTAVPFKGKAVAADTHRYKAIGNSMAVPVMRWIGERIDKYAGIGV